MQKTPGKIIMAHPRGFCAVVVRAISIVEKAPLYVRHETGHNKHVADDLKAKSAVFVRKIGDIPHGAVTAFKTYLNTSHQELLA